MKTPILLLLLLFLFQAKLGLSADCPYCNLMSPEQWQIQQNWQMRQMQAMQYALMAQQAPPPWWYSPGAVYYTNFYAPAPWQYTGVNAQYYPGVGGALLDKPNLYITGKSGTEISIKVELKEGSNWLAASPVHGENGWKGILREDHTISVKSANYSYIHYDYRVNEDFLQDSAGFCTDRKGLMPRLVEALKATGFSQKAIQDFVEYWTVKMPSSRRYCVFPQSTTELDRVATLSIEPKPQSISRLIFMVVVQEALAGNGKFAKEPTEEWHLHVQDRMPASVSDKDLVVREWGVGFMRSFPSTP